MYGPGRPPRASKHKAVSSVTHAVPSYQTRQPSIRLNSAWVKTTFSAAARHFAMATSWVEPCTSGTILLSVRASRVGVGRLTVHGLRGDLDTTSSDCEDGFDLF
jgi:hypothetical protein